MQYLATEETKGSEYAMWPRRGNDWNVDPLSAGQIRPCLLVTLAQLDALDHERNPLSDTNTHRA